MKKILFIIVLLLVFYSIGAFYLAGPISESHGLVIDVCKHKTHHIFYPILVIVPVSYIWFYHCRPIQGSFSVFLYIPFPPIHRIDRPPLT